MDNEKVGLFIAALRREHHLTQRELAEKLHVTDKAVSKWERGLSYPDVPLLPALAEILGVTVGELLNGERAQAPQPEAEAAVDNALHYAEQASARRLNNWKGVVSAIFSACCFIAILTCLICDTAINGGLGWSYYPLASVILGWGIVFPLILKGRKGIVWSLSVLTILLLPFLRLLKVLTGSALLWPIGLRISVVSLGYLWLVFLLFKLFKKRKLIAAGLSCLLGIPLCLLINLILCRIIGSVFLDVWDLLEFGLWAILAIGCFLYDRKRRL